MQSGDEDTKSGVPQTEIDEMLTFIDAGCPRLKFKGFMAMGKLNDRDGFKEVKALADRI